MTKEKKQKAAPAQDDGAIRLAAHPRARRDIAMAKGWGGLVAFVFVLVMSLRVDVPTADAIGRAIAGGIVGYVALWGIAVTVWRHLALAELERGKASILAAAAELESSSSGTR